MRKHGALLFLRPSPLGGKAAAPPYRRAARATTGALRALSYRRAARAAVPARCARRALRASPGSTAAAAALRRKAPRSGRLAASVVPQPALCLCRSPRCAAFSEHTDGKLRVFTWRFARGGQRRPLRGCGRRLAVLDKPLPTRQQGTAAASGRAGRKSGAPPREARRTKRAARGARRLLSAFPGAAAPGKSLLLAPAPASGIPPPLPVGGLVAGVRTGAPAGQNLL